MEKSQAPDDKQIQISKFMTEKIVVPKKCALIVADMQKDFCSEDGALFIGDTVNAIIARISRLI